MSTNPSDFPTINKRLSFQVRFSMTRISSCSLYTEPTGFRLLAHLAISVVLAVLPEANASDEVDPFNQPPLPVEEIDESTIPKMPPGINGLLAAYHLTPTEYAARAEKIRKVTPEVIEQLRAEYLARLDTSERFNRNYALYVCALILNKVNQFDAEGITYDRDILIDTILEKLRSDDPWNITENIHWLDRTRDRKIHAYIASFLDHEYEFVRKEAAKALPLTEPLPKAGRKEEPPSDGHASPAPPGSQNGEPATEGFLQPSVWKITGLLVILGGMITIFFGLKRRRKDA